MKKFYAKSLPEYEAPFEIDEKKILTSIKNLKKDYKLPTIVPLKISTLKDVKVLARKTGVRYQTLIQDLVTKGLKRTRK